MSDKPVRIKRRKGDKTPTYYDPIYDGVNQEAVFIFYFNPDQMARVIEELFNLYLFAEPEADDLIKTSWPVSTIAEFSTSKEPVGKTQPKNVKTSQSKSTPKTKKEKSKDQMPGSASTLEEVYDNKLFREAASAYILKNLWPSVEEFYEHFIEKVVKQALRELGESAKPRGLKKPTKKELDTALIRWNQMKRTRLGLPPQSRPKGREGFRSCEDFLTALKEVLSNPEGKPKPPNRRELWQKLRRHDLYKGKKKGPVEGHEAQTLDNWFDDCGIENIDEAIRLYWKGPANEE